MTRGFLFVLLATSKAMFTCCALNCVNDSCCLNRNATLDECLCQQKPNCLQDSNNAGETMAQIGLVIFGVACVLLFYALCVDSCLRRMKARRQPIYGMHETSAEFDLLQGSTSFSASTN